MNAQNTNSVPKTQARRTGPPVAAGQWWKAWVLLTGLGVTVFGWMALPRDEPPPVTGIISSQVSMAADRAPVVRGERIDRPRQISTGIRTLPGMPEKPVFPDSYKPGLPGNSIFDTDTLVGFSGGDVAPWFPGSRFTTLDP